MTELLFDLPSNTGITKIAIPVVPTTPTNVQAVAQNSTVVVTWDSAVGKYNVYRNSDYVATVTAQTWTDELVVNNTLYSYEIVAVDDANPEGFRYSLRSIAATITFTKAVPFGTPVHTSKGAVLTDATHMVTWTNPDRPATRNYSQEVNSVSQGASEVNTNSKLVTVPTDGSVATIATKYWDFGDQSEPIRSISYDIQTVNFGSVDLTGYTKIKLPPYDIYYGSFRSGELGAALNPATPWYMNGSGDVTMGYVENGRALVARLRPLTLGTPSNKIESAVYLPSIITDRTPFKLSFEMRLRSGFDFGADPTQQSFNFGFGLRSLIDSSSGAPDYSGWSLGWVAQGNGDDTVNANLMSYSADTASVGPGDIIATDHQINANTWSQYTMDVVLNDPGQSNGILRVWISGVERINIQNMRYQAQGAPNISGISWTNFYNEIPAATSYLEFRSIAWKAG